MKVTVRFSYTEDVVPPRCRKPRRTRFHDGELRVNIPEISKEMAPVAIVATRRKSSWQSGYRIEYRWYKNKLWTAVDMNNYRHPEIPGVIDLTEGNHSWPGISLYAGYLAHSTKFDAEKEIRSAMKLHLYIDGVHYRLTGEPRYEVNTFGMGRNHGSTAIFIEHCYNQNIGRDRYFSLLELDKAVALATDIATKRGDTKSLPMRLNGGEKFEIRLPEAIRVNPKRQHGTGCSFINALDSVSMATGGSPAAVMGAALALI